MSDHVSSRAIAQALRLLADALDAQPVAVAATVDDDAPLPEKEVLRRRPGTSAGWLRGHVQAVGRGARQCRVYRLADVDRALAAHPVPPRPRKCTPEDEHDPISAMVASGELVARRGTR